MNPAVVVDVGNSFIKWARCRTDGVTDKASLAHDEPDSWERQCAAWDLGPEARWAVCGVRPHGRDELVKWLRRRGDHVVVLEYAAQLPLTVRLEHPDKVGIDRLLDAVAANAERRPHTPAVVIDAGSAVTVDLVDERGDFRGGAIFPGLRLMAKALHDYTALLPLIQVNEAAPLPGRSTPAAMHAGIYWATVGGIRTIVEETAPAARHTEDESTNLDIFLTGGDTTLLMPTLERMFEGRSGWRFLSRPNLTLDGIRLAAEALP